jgi:hypothetical protein
LKIFSYGGLHMEKRNASPEEIAAYLRRAGKKTITRCPATPGLNRSESDAKAFAAHNDEEWERFRATLQQRSAAAGDRAAKTPDWQRSATARQSWARRRSDAGVAAAANEAPAETDPPPSRMPVQLSTPKRPSAKAIGRGASVQKNIR